MKQTRSASLSSWQTPQQAHQEECAIAMRLDLSGLTCPLPVLKLEKTLRHMDFGTVVEVIATDPVSVIDIPHFCQQNGHFLRAQHPISDGFYFRIQKQFKAAPPE